MGGWSMKFFSLHSLTMRIWTIFIVLTTVIISAISLITLTIINKQNQTNQVQSLLIGHETITQIMTNNTTFSDSKPPRLGSTDFRHIQHLLIECTSSTTSNLEIFPLDPRLKEQGINVDTLGKWLFDHLSDSASSSLYYKDAFEGTEYLFVISSISTDEIPSYLVSYVILLKDNHLIYFTILIGILFIIISLIGAKTISIYISKPLKQLEVQTLKIASKDWIAPMPPSDITEINSVIHSINNMQQALQIADKEQQQFLQSISHDLKTPIMVIIAHAQAIIDHMYIDDLESTAEIIKTEGEKLDARVKQILYFNTLDYALINQDTITSVDLDLLLKELVGHFQPLSSCLKWQSTLTPVQITGNIERLQVAFENILTNQMRYAYHLIKIVLRIDNNLAIIHIFNDGAPIDEALLPHIFEEFYKDSKGNFGLGLAIAKKIINFYEGSISATNETGGVCFKIILPLK